jgi:hypothetical protein
VVTTWTGGVALAALLLTGRHPMHTSTAELRQEQPHGAVSVTVRLFLDDLQGAVPGAGQVGTDSALAAYVRSRFVLADPGGRPAALRFTDAAPAGDVIVVRLVSEEVELSGARVSHALLSERFADQVNVVRATYAGRNATLLFLPGDAVKRLP